MEKEIRKISGSVNNSDSRLIDGYASVFNSLSEDLGGFKEKIDTKAFDNVIEKSDVFALLNHDSKRGILARSKFGKGTLKLLIDKKGLKYSFEAPATALGDECLEMIKRGDIDSSSFAFSVAKDQWDKQSDGTYIRTILQFGELFDISPVYQPAYSDTTACKRFLEIKETDEAFERAKQETEPEAETEPVEIQEPEIENQEETEAVDNQEENIEQENPSTETETEVVEEIENDTESTETETVEPEDKEEENKKRSIENNAEIEIRNNKKNSKKMKEIRLIDLIAKQLEGRELSQNEQDLLSRGSAQLRSLGFNSNKNSINVSFREQRDINATGAGFGLENVAEEKLDLLGPLYKNLTLKNAGAQVLTNLNAQMSLPNYAGSTVAWKGETVAADDGSGAFSEVILTPKRITCVIPVSREFIIEDQHNAVSIVEQDIMTKVSEKIEETILGNLAGNANQPAGLFYGITATTVPSYSGITSMEAALEDKNVKNYSFIVNPKAKFALKSTKINEGKMIYDGDTIDGVPTYSSTCVFGKGIVAADFKDLFIGIWGMEFVYDELTKADSGQVRLIVNAYVDAAFRRPSYVVANLA